MAWTAPITFTAGSTLLFSDLNTYLRDNMLQMAPAIGTTVGDYFIGSAANTLARRLPVSSRQAASVNTANTTYTLLGASTPTVTASTGIKALVLTACRLENSTVNVNAFCSYAISGTTTAAAADNVGINIDGITAANFLRLGQVNLESALTAGTGNTFTHSYRAGGGTATFQDRLIAVLPF